MLFADDTNIFVSDSSYEGVVQKANDIPTLVSSNMFSNKLHINYMKKSCYIPFKPSINDKDSMHFNIPVKINSFEINEVETTKFPGVTIDNKLSWIPQLKSLAKKLRCCTGQLSRIKNSISKSIHKSLYHTLFESHLTYGITVWGKVSNVKINPVFVAEKYCLRIEAYDC